MGAVSAMPTKRASWCAATKAVSMWSASARVVMTSRPPGAKARITWRQRLAGQPGDHHGARAGDQRIATTKGAAEARPTRLRSARSVCRRSGCRPSAEHDEGGDDQRVGEGAGRPSRVPCRMPLASRAPQQQRRGQPSDGRPGRRWCPPDKQISAGDVGERPDRRHGDGRRFDRSAIQARAGGRPAGRSGWSARPRPGGCRPASQSASSEDIGERAGDGREERRLSIPAGRRGCRKACDRRSGRRTTLTAKHGEAERPASSLRRPVRA